MERAGPIHRTVKVNMAQPYTIGGINSLPENQKHNIYCDLIPRELNERFNHTYNLSLIHREDHSSSLNGRRGIHRWKLALYHRVDFPDPILYGHLTDTVNGQIHVLLYILNDPDSQRFDVDKMPDGRHTKFGTMLRNIEAEKAAFEAGLSPGQVRHGLRLLQPAIIAFEKFRRQRLDMNLYFVEPLYYHNAVIFERYGFAYQQGRKLMESIQAGFSDGGDLFETAR